MKEAEGRRPDSTAETDDQLDPETADDGFKTVADAWSVGLGQPGPDEQADEAVEGTDATTEEPPGRDR